MRDEHIRKLLDEAPLASLGRAELAAIRAHAAVCEECRRAFDAAQVSSQMLKARGSETFEPSPFFQTRVLAALRERRAAEEERWTLARLWKSAGLLVSSLAATTAALAVFTFVAPSETTVAQGVASGNAYTAESVIFDDAGDEQMTYDQVLTSLYGSEEEAAR
jgi:predicted anti-sigma-YlaC factor YlaD